MAELFLVRGTVTEIRHRDGALVDLDEIRLVEANEPEEACTKFKDFMSREYYDFHSVRDVIASGVIR